MTGFAERLLRGADESASPGSKLRKRRKTEAAETAKNLVDSILQEVSPVNKSYLNRPKVSAISMTAVRKADENDLTKSDLHGGQNVRHRESDHLGAKSTTYGKSAHLDRLELRRNEIRRRWAEILQRSGCPFVDRADSEEVIRLADELDELDRLASRAIPVGGLTYPMQSDSMEAIL